MAIPFDPRTGLPTGTPKASTPLAPVFVGPGRSLEPKPAPGNYGAGGDPFDPGLGLATPTATSTAPAVSTPSAPSSTFITPPAPATAPAALDVADPATLATAIQNDPLYKQTQADIAAARAADQATRAAARQSSLVQWGGIPDFSSAAGALGLIGGDIAGDVTPTVQQLAQQNTNAGLSTTSRLNQAYDDTVKSTKDNLTSRGLLSSGETGYQLGRDLQTSNQNRSDALQALINTLTGYENNYLTNENGRLGQLSAAAQAAAGRIPPVTAPLTFGVPGTTVGGVPVTQGVNDQVPIASLPDFTNPDLTGNETSADLAGLVTQPDPVTGLYPVGSLQASGLFPADSALPVAIKVLANPSGASANRKQGIFSIH